MRPRQVTCVLIVVSMLCSGLLLQALPARAVGVWARATPVPATFAEHSATPLPGGQVLVTGIVLASTLFRTAIYDPAADRWSNRVPLPPLQGWQAPTPLRDGRVLFSGGGNLAGTPSGARPLAAAQVYDPIADAWTPVASLSTARLGHTATTLQDGTVLVVGGDVSTDYGPPQATASAERYDPTTNRWTTAGQLATARYFHTATLLPDGRVLVVGGSTNDARGIGGLATATAELYDSATNRWTSTRSMAMPHGAGHTATLLPDGQVLITGGDTTSAVTPITAAAERYDPAANRWSSAGMMSTPRGDHTATLLRDGRVLIVGGTSAHAISASTILATTELYDPVGNVWVGATPLGGPRYAHTATLLPDGRVLVVGGAGGDGPTNSAEIYTPVGEAACFPETGKCIRGPFLAYWQAHGGLALNGYPLSDEFTQVLEDGKSYTVQYFERVRMEYHPENPPPYDLLLGQFGRRILAGVPNAPTAPAARKDGYTYFEQTGHNISPRFSAYWQANGGLMQFGFPISEEFTQTLEDGQPYTVQYFERARFEYHPENAPPWEIELGQFGRRVLAESGR